MKDVTINLTRAGKLPNTIECGECQGEMHRRFGGGVYKRPVYRCRECGAVTTLYLSKAQKARGLS